MNKDLTRKQTPEERELENKRAQLTVLETELAQHEPNLATLKAELTVFETRYLREVGIFYAELDEIEAQISELSHNTTWSIRDKLFVVKEIFTRF